MGGFSVSRARRAAGHGALSLAVAALVVVGSVAPAGAAAAASIEPTTVSAGDEYTISGAGWPADRGVGFLVEANGASFFLPNAETGGDGSFSVTRVWPTAIPPGDHELSVIANVGGDVVRLPITVVGDEPPPPSPPTVTVTPTAVAAGDEITVSGTGWDAGASSPLGITFYVNGTDFFPGPGFAGSLASPFPEFDGTFSVTTTVPADVPPGDHLIRVHGSAGDFPTPVDAPLTVLGATAPPSEETEPPPEEQPPVVSPSPQSGAATEPEVAGATESAPASGSTGELPRTGSWSALLVGLGVALTLAGAVLVGFARGGGAWKRGRSRALVRVLALVASVTLLVAACGDSDDNGDDAADEATEEPAEESGGEDVDVEGLDYAGALFTIEDFESFVPGDYVVDDQGAADNEPIHGLCGAEPAGPVAAGGEFLIIQDAGPSFSFLTSVQAYETDDEAEQAFSLARSTVESCEEFDEQGSLFVTIAPVDIPESGDESLDLFTQQVIGDLFVADHFVRNGQFVFDVRMVRSQGSTFSAETLATMASEAQDKFNDWVEEQAGG